MLKNTVGLLLLLFYLHGIGLWLFIRGFLLSRLSLSQVSACDPIEICTIPPTHKRAVFLIIDALRFDFISPEIPVPGSPYHHGVLTLPAELTAKFPQNSFIFNCLTIESSSISLAPKFEPISTNVGKEPVVIPFMRCKVVVGGSE